MTKLDEMWAALAAYQPQANAAGHGETWARMCSEKTYAAADADAAAYAADYDAASAAYAAAYAVDYDAAAAVYSAAVYSAADADVAAYDAAAADYWAQKAIDRIKEITNPPASQRPWVGLTEKEAEDIWQSCAMRMPTEFAKALEAKLKEKNT